MTKTYRSTAAQQFADRFEPLRGDFIIDGGGKIGRYRVSGGERSKMIARYEESIGWSKWRTLGGIALMVVFAWASREYLGYALRISTFLLWLSPVIATALVEERRRFVKALGELRLANYLGPSDPFYRRWSESQAKQSWGALLVPGMGLFSILIGTPLKMPRTALDWTDQAFILAYALLWITPMILKAWQQYRQPAAV